MARNRSFGYRHPLGHGKTGLASW